MSNGPPRTCEHCGRYRRHHARGLCRCCYNGEWVRGVLDCHPLRPDDPRYFRPRITADDIDHAVIERILSGEWRMKCTPSEKAEVCRRWVLRGRPLADLERLTGWATHRYYRLRDDARVAS